MQEQDTLQPIREFTETSAALQAIERWKRTYDQDIDKLFSRFFPKPLGQEAQEGNSKYPDQWSKNLGINYGLFPENLIQIIRSGTTEETYPKIILHLAVLSVESLSPSPEDQCVILIEAKRRDGTNGTSYFAPALPEGMSEYNRSIFNYDIKNAAQRVLQPFYGISRELRDQLAYNWLVSSFSVTDLFYTLASPESHQAGETPKLEPGQQCFVRAHSYCIGPDNLMILRQEEVLTDHSFLRIRFGVNPSSQFLNADYFAPIIEILPLTEGDPPHTPDETKAVFIDFVGANPPGFPESQNNNGGS